MAEAIIGKVANDLGIRRHVQIGRYGPAVNAFALGTGLLLSGQPLPNLLIPHNLPNFLDILYTIMVK